MLVRERNPTVPSVLGRGGEGVEFACGKLLEERLYVIFFSTKEEADISLFFVVIFRLIEPPPPPVELKFDFSELASNSLISFSENNDKNPTGWAGCSARKSGTVEEVEISASVLCSVSSLSFILFFGSFVVNETLNVSKSVLLPVPSFPIQIMLK